MTDAAYTYYQTEKERRASRTGAFHKKNGSRSKKCTLPSDRLTAKQRKELNGKVETYNLGKPMSWIEFLQMPHYLQETYLNNLIEQYGARRKDVLMTFDVSQSTFGKFLREKFPDKHFWDNKPSSHKPSQKWLDFMGWTDEDLPQEDDNVQPEPSESVKQAKETEVIVEPAEEKKEVSLDVISGTLKYVGDPYAAFTKALLAFDTSKDYDIYISFRQVGKEGALDKSSRNERG